MLARAAARVARVSRVGWLGLVLMLRACRAWRVRAVWSVEHLWMAQNVVLCRVMAACCASLRSGRRAAGGVRDRSVGAEPMKGGAAHGVDARGLVGERGLGIGNGLLTLHVCTYLLSFLVAHPACVWVPKKIVEMKILI